MNTERLNDLENGIERRIATFAERAIKTLTGNSGIFGHVGHTPRPRNDAQRVGYVRRIACRKRLRKKVGAAFIVGQMVSRIEVGQFDHYSISLISPANIRTALISRF